MQWYHYALAILATVSLWSSWRVSKAALYIALLAMSYVLSVLYWHFKPDNPYFPHGSIIGFMLDAIVFVIVRQIHDDKWEFWGVVIPVSIMAFIGFYQVVGSSIIGAPVLRSLDYSVMLEALNAAALLIIGGVGLVERDSNRKALERVINKHCSPSVSKACYSIAKSSKKASTAKKITSL